MEYSSDKVMTRKEYLKKKRKSKFGLRTLKYILLLIVIALLGVYLFRQLDIYNNVTKIANKVVEETALARTMKMYYIADGYSKDANGLLTVYRSSDNSRQKITGTDGIENIKLYGGMLYGIIDGNLMKIDLETGLISQVIEKNIEEYVIEKDYIYIYRLSNKEKEVGIYAYNLKTGEEEQLINTKIQQLLIDENYIFVVTKGKTEKSIVRYNLNGSGRTILSNKEIVTSILQDKSHIYYIANNKLYMMTKSGKNSTIVLEDEIYADKDSLHNYTAENIFVVKDNLVYYINKSEENHLYVYDKKTNKKQLISKKNIESLQLVDNILYFKLNDALGIYKVNLDTGKTEKVTSIRGNEYICVN